jgi:hypothetical protein
MRREKFDNSHDGGARGGPASSATYEDGDLDGDGDVDLSDLSGLLSVYATACKR